MSSADEDSVLVRMVTFSRGMPSLSARRMCGWLPYRSALSQKVTPWSYPSLSRLASPSTLRLRVWSEFRSWPLVPVPMARRLVVIPVEPRVTRSLAALGLSAAKR